MTVKLDMPKVKIISKTNIIDTGKSQLHMVDLNLLAVFDAVMQEQNTTRAAHILRVSRPAVNNTVARLKVISNDELFIRYGRGIQPTTRTFQLFSSIHQALRLVQNKLPGSDSGPVSSEHVFNLCVCSPLDNILMSLVYNRVEQVTPSIHVVLRSSLNQSAEHQLRYQGTEFVISYEELRRPEFTNIPLFNDKMVLVASKKHPRISGPLLESNIYSEQHTVVSLNRLVSSSQPWYDIPDKQSCVTYQDMALISILNIVSQTHLVSIAPRWLTEEFSSSLELQILPLPLKLNNHTCYLSRHETAGRDEGHQWMEELLVSVCEQQHLAE